MNKMMKTATILAMLSIAAVATAQCKKKAKEGDTADTTTTAALSADEVAKAKKMYTEKCASCHGPMGKGDGPAGPALKARNFAKLEEYKQGTSADQIAMTIDKGVDGGKTGMAGALVPDAADRTLIAKLIVSEFQK